jgi:hypothetical protein
MAYITMPQAGALVGMTVLVTHRSSKDTVASDTVGKVLGIGAITRHHPMIYALIVQGANPILSLITLGNIDRVTDWRGGGVLFERNPARPFARVPARAR